MKLRLKWWVKDLLKIIFILLLVYIIISMFTQKRVVVAPGKNYTCYGSQLFSLCVGETYE